jgi:hypothetical protein
MKDKKELEDKAQELIDLYEKYIKNHKFEALFLYSKENNFGCVFFEGDFEKTENVYNFVINYQRVINEKTNQ